MKNWLLKLTSNEPDLKAVKEKYSDLLATVAELERSFSSGGAVLRSQLEACEISTTQKQVPYPTGTNCLSYRLPDISGKLVFYTKCVAPPNEVGKFGGHWHPRSGETNVVLSGSAKSNGQYIGVFGVVFYGPGIVHDFEAIPGTTWVTIFDQPVN